MNIISLLILSCNDNNASNQTSNFVETDSTNNITSDNMDMHNMTWYTANFEYEGLPLFVRKPGFENIYEFESKFPFLFFVSHQLDSVMENGLPTADYNLTLMKFDSFMTDLFSTGIEGIPVLKETYNGERNYWYYVDSDKYTDQKKQFIQENFPNLKIQVNCALDEKWGFIREYPFDLYPG
ncbi:DUF695 domain-containing protein [Paracrocinitomix mangrovi]|uniref:DUF695 domain-containing protein n=1 Tax=Paracrocinitomix mangrovi TaxID=2862509 RepID=UPI001C8DE0EF|nr:DUF695 domain-containing protein [Paracrocinitomix mangrovi]UKN02711.1 DUF695 domain-containing protein [Paracrocinitomix mangrovi]